MNSKIETIYICSRCGRQAFAREAFGNWLIAKRRGKQTLVVRCPECKTGYALRIAEKKPEKPR